MSRSPLYNRLLKLLMGVVLMSTFSCAHVDDDRIPWSFVRLPFSSPQWSESIRPAAGVHHRFVKSTLQPSWYPYTEISATGFGGILLVIDYANNPVAYDLACPYEVRRDVLIEVDGTTSMARCPKCGSTYHIFNNYGLPASGPSADRNYALRRYNVDGPLTGIDYYIVQN